MYIEILILRSPYKLLMVTLHNLPEGHLLDIVLLKLERFERKWVPSHKV